MIAPLARFIDWSALQLAYCAIGLKHEPEEKWRLEEALEFLNGPDFFPAGSEPAAVEFDGERDFKFPTPRPCEFEENNTVYGRLYRCAERWNERPGIILLDGYPPVGYHTGFPLLARWFNRAGLNVATFVAPYDFQRYPRGATPGDCLEFSRRVAQHIAEIRALTGWLLGEGWPSVGLLGISNGGWIAGFTACGDARIACAVLAAPRVYMRNNQPVIWRQVRKTLKALRPAQEALDTTRLNLVLSRPVIPKENLLLIEGTEDLFASRESIEELWQKWEQPEIWRLSHGHVSLLCALGLTGRVLDWLSPRLKGPGVLARPGDAGV